MNTPQAVQCGAYANELNEDCRVQMRKLQQFINRHYDPKTTPGKEALYEINKAIAAAHQVQARLTAALEATKLVDYYDELTNDGEAEEPAKTPEQVEQEDLDNSPVIKYNDGWIKDAPPEDFIESERKVHPPIDWLDSSVLDTDEEL